MPDINKKILDGVEPYHFSEYGIGLGDLNEFLFNAEPFLARQGKAIKIIEQILTYHGKEWLLKHVSELARVEHGIRELEPWVRDHVVHALLSFLLGVYLNEKYLPALHCPMVNRFQWKLSGLLHDVAYPGQIARDVLKPFSETINSIKRDLGVPAPDVYFKIVPTGIDELRNGVNSFVLIQEKIDNWCLRIDARREYDKVIDSGKICHGMLSGLAVLYVIDLMYQKFNPEREHRSIIVDGAGIDWNQTYFENDVAEACAAIYIHNLSPCCFVRSKISPKKAPLAFLLKLSDVLQEWQRPSLEHRRGHAPDKFDVDVLDRKLVFKADINEKRKEKMRQELDYTLDTNGISIL